jgi:D-sedoheptulose 7-phosphate isomerase
MFDHYLKELVETLGHVSSTDADQAIQVVRDAFLDSKSIFIAGNGGSSATASHITVDWQKGIGKILKRSIHVDCLTDNVPLLTAYSNDESYVTALGSILKGKSKPGDLLITISGSGNSQNIIHLVDVGKKLGCTIMSLTGFDGGQLKNKSDFNLNVPSSNMQIIEDIHGMFGHMVLKSYGE